MYYITSWLRTLRIQCIVFPQALYMVEFSPSQKKVTEICHLGFSDHRVEELNVM